MVLIAAARILRRLATVLLRNGIAFQAFAEIAKQAFVDAAARDFAVEGRKPSMSRIAVLTGLTRKDVARLARGDQGAERAAGARYNRAARVVSGWVRDVAFADD